MKQGIKLILASALVVVVLALLPGSCISEFQAELPVKEDDILVVTGDIVENTEVEFVLSKSFSINSAKPSPESQNVAATITVVGSDGTKSQPATSVGSGVYRLAVGELKDDVAYGIRIEYFGNVYTSGLSKPLRTPEIDEVTWAQPEKYGDISLRVSTHDDTASEPQYYLWNYQEDWEFPARYYTEIYLNYKTAQIDTFHFNYRYNCWKKNTINNILVGSTEALIGNKMVDHQLLEYPSSDDRFLSLYCLTLSQKAISKEAYEYYSAKRTENEEMGGLFTPQPNEVKGNIVCQTDPSKRTIGYISVLKNVAWKRKYVDRAELTCEDLGCPLFADPPQGDMRELHIEPVGTWFYDEIKNKVEFDIGFYLSEMCRLHFCRRDKKQTGFLAER